MGFIDFSIPKETIKINVRVMTNFQNFQQRAIKRGLQWKQQIP